jgi:hypothetical protein
MRERFVSNNKSLTSDDVARIQDNMSDCRRPERGLEYKKDSSQQSTPEPPDPFGIDHEKARPTDYSAQ